MRKKMVKIVMVGIAVWMTVSVCWAWPTWNKAKAIINDAVTANTECTMSKDNVKALMLKISKEGGNQGFHYFNITPTNPLLLRCYDYKTGKLLKGEINWCKFYDSESNSWALFMSFKQNTWEGSYMNFCDCD
jgi:hypothetical protein